MSAQSKLETIIAARRMVFAETTARKRIEALLDQDSFVELDGFAGMDDSGSGVICGYGSVMGGPVYAFAQEGGADGAVGMVQAAKIRKVYDMALKTGAPVVGIYDSNGVRLSEGVKALSACGDILLQANNLSGVIPQISVVLGTCVGTAAMLACCADFVIMSTDAEFHATPPKGKGTAGAGSAQAAAKSGVAHIVSDTEDNALQAARLIITRFPINNLASPPFCDYTDPQHGEDVLRALCENGFTDADALVSNLFDQDSSIELLKNFGSSVYTSLTTMGGFPCGAVVTTGKALSADDCAKISRFVMVLDSFQLPVVTLVNTPGMETSDSTLCVNVRDMARMTHVYAEATTGKLAVIIGDAVGSAYVALASRAVNSDYTVAWPSAMISPLTAETAVAFLHGDKITKDNPRSAVEADYRENEASAVAAAKAGIIDDVIDPGLTRPALLAAMDLLSAKRMRRNPKKHSNLPL